MSRRISADDVSLIFGRFARSLDSEPGTVYRRWALGVADDNEVCELLATCPSSQVSPSLVFAVCRLAGTEVGPYSLLRHTLVGDFDEVRSLLAEKTQQTNDVGRCIATLVGMARMKGPLGVIEVGASAGLGLLLDKYSYRFLDGENVVHSLDPGAGPSEVIVETQCPGSHLHPRALPNVAYRVGLDVKPVKVTNEEHTQWLEYLVWPGHDDRRDNLRNALRIALDEPPVIEKGDLVDDLLRALADVPTYCTPVVVSSAVMPFVSEEKRIAFGKLLAENSCRSVIVEGRSFADSLGCTQIERAGDQPFVLAVDQKVIAGVGVHGRSITST